MARSKIPSDRQLIRQLKLRDLRIFSSVAETGSMAKAAAELGIAQPSVSESVAALEHLYDVRLFDRSPRGVALTAYGEALRRRCAALFEEVRQSSFDMDHLADPSSGSLRIASLEGYSASILPQILESFVEAFPRVV